MRSIEEVKPARTGSIKPERAINYYEIN